MMGDEPKPKDPEIVATERICQEMRDMAKRLPRPVGKTTEGIIPQLGDDLLHFFLSLKNFRQEGSGGVEDTNKTKKLYGDKWKRFLEEN